MNSQDFFTKAKYHLDHNFPFVLYRKADFSDNSTFQLQAFFQENNELHLAEDYSEAGFVMGAFDLRSQKSPLLPSVECQRVSTNIPVKELSFTSEKEKELPLNKQAKNFHINLVEKGIEAIQNSQMKKVVLSRRLDYPFQADILDTFKRMLFTYRTAFVYCWFHPKVGLWLGATPETLLKVKGDEFKTMALAGTKPADENALPNWTQKEIEEQQYVTDFIEEILEGNVNQLQIGKVNNIRAGKLWHLKCDIKGKISSLEKLGKIIDDLHPTPAVCGMPKEISKQFIVEHENYDREFYTGFLGELNIDDNKTEKLTELFVNLRCMQIKDKTAKIYVGGGIVKDSNPESEWQETVNKSKTMLDVILESERE